MLVIAFSSSPVCRFSKFAIRSSDGVRFCECSVELDQSAQGCEGKVDSMGRPLRLSVH